MCAILGGLQHKEVYKLGSSLYNTTCLHIGNQNDEPVERFKFPLRIINKDTPVEEHNIIGMSYNLLKNELYIAYNEPKVKVYAMGLDVHPYTSRKIYEVEEGSKIFNVHYINSSSNTLLVCSYEQSKCWLVAVNCSSNKLVKHPVRTEEREPELISCALSDSRVLIGASDSNYMELFRVKSSIELICNIAYTVKYLSFSASSDIDTLLAMCYRTDEMIEVSLHRVKDNQLSGVLGKTKFKSFAENTDKLLWFADRFFATEYHVDYHSHKVIEIKFENLINGIRSERRLPFIAASEEISVQSWCAVNEGIAIFDSNSTNIYYYKVKSFTKSTAVKLQAYPSIPKHTLIKSGGKDPGIGTMTSSSDKLFFSDFKNKTVGVKRLRDNPYDMRNEDVICANRIVLSVCYMNDSDTLVLCWRDQSTSWLEALRCNSGVWSAMSGMKPVAIEILGMSSIISNALSNSQVLIGEENSDFMELLKVKGDRSILHIRRINNSEKYACFSANCESETRLAISCRASKSVKIYRLRAFQLEQLACSIFQNPGKILWLADRLLVAEFQNEFDTVTELVVQSADGHMQLEQRSQVITAEQMIVVNVWCPVKEGIAIFDGKSGDILHFERM